jgi:sigma-B regulation protein RsbQ
VSVVERNNVPIAEPERFSRLVLVGPSPRYIDDDGHRGGFGPAGIGEPLKSLDSIDSRLGR